MTYLIIDQPDPKDVWEEEDGLILGVVDGRSGDVDINAIDLGLLA